MSQIFLLSTVSTRSYRGPDVQERQALNLVLGPLNQVLGSLEAPPRRCSMFLLPWGYSGSFSIAMYPLAGGTISFPSRAVLPRAKAYLHSTWIDTWLEEDSARVCLLHACQIQESLSCLLICSYKARTNCLQMACGLSGATL